jgi:Domain of unknown function (DUF4336)
MTAIKLSDGSVWVHSPVALTEEIAEKLQEIGPVKHVVIGNVSVEHSMFAGAYAKMYPSATFYAPVPQNSLPIPARFRIKSVEVLNAQCPESWLGLFDQVNIFISIKNCERD